MDIFLPQTHSAKSFDNLSYGCLKKKNFSEAYSKGSLEWATKIKNYEMTQSNTKDSCIKTQDGFYLRT